jgi:hypothetical protein
VSDHMEALAECNAAQEEGRLISDAAARVIASWWREGKIGESFVSCGAIQDVEDLWKELTVGGNGMDFYQEASVSHKFMLDKLREYLVAKGQRGPVAGWHELWVR